MMDLPRDPDREESSETEIEFLEVID